MPLLHLPLHLHLHLQDLQQLQGLGSWQGLGNLAQERHLGVAHFFSKVNTQDGK
jgi:hypothetical protein